jgi:hypothetical protein
VRIKCVTIIWKRTRKKLKTIFYTLSGDAEEEDSAHHHDINLLAGLCMEI